MRQCLSQTPTQHGIKITMSYKGMLPLRHTLMCKELGGSLLLFITYFPVTQSIKCLEQKMCKAPREPRACWVVFSARGEAQRELLREEDGNNRQQKRNSYSVAHELQWGGEIVLQGFRLPVFTKCVVIHALGLHVWVKVLFFFYCSQNEEQISVISTRDGCQWRSLCPLTAALFEQVWVSVPDSLHLFTEWKISASLRKDCKVSNKCFQMSLNMFK